MNTVLTYLTENWNRLQLDGMAPAPRLSSVMATPRFRASSHVIFFILAEGKSEPVLVAKVPRLPGDNGRLDREAMNLRAVHQARNGGFDSIPRVIAYEEYSHHKLLIETAIIGEPMKPALVRHNPRECIELGLSWLIDLHSSTACRNNVQQDWFDRLVAKPLAEFKAIFPALAEEARLIDRVFDLAGGLKDCEFPLVMSHEDFSHPNILLSGEERIGVVDWELAEQNGLPAMDLFFFLTYIAFARRRAQKNSQYLASFQEAFFGTQAWAASHLAHYVEKVNLSIATLPPLFILCWTRYLWSLAARLHASDEQSALHDFTTLKWLRENRYYHLWRYAIEHVDGLKFVA